jgi:hypothetical protein
MCLEFGVFYFAVSFGLLMRPSTPATRNKDLRKEGYQVYKKERMNSE